MLGIMVMITAAYMLHSRDELAGEELDAELNGPRFDRGGKQHGHQKLIPL
jgi:hypothetical protein